MADLTIVRDELVAPTRLAVVIARRSGAKVTRVAPGRVEATLENGDTVEIVVRQANPYVREVEAYRREGRSVPEDVLYDLKRWDREHGRTR